MYKIVGADGRVYGPVSAEQIQQWITEGRANARTQTLAEGAAAWKPLGLFPEFAHRFAAQVPPIAPTSPPIPPLTAAGPRRTSGWALAGLIFGVLSIVLCCCPFVFSIPGLIFSLIGLSQVSGKPQLYEGRGMAVIGLVLSIIALVLGIIWTIASIANGNLHVHHEFHILSP